VYRAPSCIEHRRVLSSTVHHSALFIMVRYGGRVHVLVVVLQLEREAGASHGGCIDPVNF
jgi:hypothetical protein